MKKILSRIHNVVTPFYLFGPWNKGAKAAWPALSKLQHEAYSNRIQSQMLKLRGFEQNWAYRQAIPVTSTYGSAQANVFLSFTLDTATLITAGKLHLTEIVW